MKNLFSSLFSLLPPQPKRMSIPDMVEVARVYITRFQRHIEELSQRRMQYLVEEEANNRATTIPPVLNIMEFNSIMEINLITGSNMAFTLSDIISIIEEEGAQVLNVTYNTAGNTNILSIRCQAVYARIGIENSRLLHRLRTMIEE
ncbi:hypothetical protein CCACVL1_07581 [Corchorus capsularis]|uniref:BHLH domain-containing protein n=1 Tax=Corchorus capsularis TaxID=210143 RepID=A0A1R3J4V7_COCAP|nr:hypothetical protein CCACVL1_07581 [Corchorus capsularis]